MTFAATISRRRDNRNVLRLDGFESPTRPTDLCRAVTEMNSISAGEAAETEDELFPWVRLPGGDLEYRG